MLGINRYKFSIQNFFKLTSQIKNHRHALAFNFRPFLIQPGQKPLPNFNHRCCLEILRIIDLGYRGRRIPHVKHLFYTLSYYSKQFSEQDMLNISNKLYQMGMKWHHFPNTLQNQFIHTFNQPSVSYQVAYAVLDRLPKLIQDNKDFPHELFQPLFNAIQSRYRALSTKQTAQLFKNLASLKFSCARAAQFPTLPDTFQQCLFKLLHHHFHQFNHFEQQEMMNHLRKLRAWPKLSQTTWPTKLCQDFKQTGNLGHLQALSQLNQGWEVLCQEQLSDAVKKAILSANDYQLLSVFIIFKQMNLCWDKQLHDYHHACLNALDRLPLTNMNITTLLVTLNGINLKWSDLSLACQRKLTARLDDTHLNFGNRLTIFLNLAKMKCHHSRLIDDLLYGIKKYPPADSASTQMFLTAIFHLKKYLPKTLHRYRNLIQTMRERVSLETQISSTQGAFTRQLSQQLPHYQVKSEALIDDCISVDILIKKPDENLSIIIEIDGNHHYPQGRLRVKDIQRDLALEENCYQVYRIPVQLIETPDALHQQARLVAQTIQSLFSEQTQDTPPVFSPQFKQAHTSTKKAKTSARSTLFCP